MFLLQYHALTLEIADNHTNRVRLKLQLVLVQVQSELQRRNAIHGHRRVVLEGYITFLQIMRLDKAVMADDVDLPYQNGEGGAV